MKLLVLAHLTGMINSMIYQEIRRKDRSSLQVVYKESDVASKISCVHRCVQLKCDALYNDKMCQCVSESTSSSIVGNDPLEEGIFIKSIGNVNNLEFKILKTRFNISKNNQIYSIARIKKEYHIKVMFKVDISQVTTAGQWHNVFLITNGEKTPQYGYRHPGIFLTPQRDEFRLQVYNTMNTAPSYGGAMARGTTWFNDWVTVDIRQKYTTRGYRYSIHVNDFNLRRETTNRNPMEFSNMKVYASDPWHRTIDGNVKVNFIEGFEGVEEV